jgi:hypothetical protein
MRNKLLVSDRLVGAFAVAAALPLGLTGRRCFPGQGEQGRVIDMDIYTPAPGWTEERLADELRAQGKRDVVVTSAAVIDWNPAAQIYSFYLWNSCPFQAGARCIDVWSGNYRPGWHGLTHLRRRACPPQDRHR